MLVEHRCTNFGMETKRVEGDGVITGYGKVNGRKVCIRAGLYGSRRLDQRDERAENFGYPEKSDENAGADYRID